MRKRFGSRRGNAMVEFALAAPMLAVCFTSCFQFGYYFYIYDRLESAVRAGARYASLRSYDSSTSTPANDFTTAVNNMVVYGSPSGGTTPVVSGLSTSNVNLTVTMNNSTPNLMQVSISGYRIDGIFGTWNLGGKPVAIFRYEGRFAPGS